MTAAWQVFINLITRSNFGLVSANMARQSAATANAVQRDNQKMSQSMNNTASVVRGGLLKAMDAVGVASAVAFATGIKGAADMQDAMNQLSVTLGRPVAQLGAFQAAAVSMSKVTAQSVSSSLNILRQMANLGIPEKSIIPLSRPMSLFADVAYLGRFKTPFEDSVAAAVRIAHDMGIYEEAPMRKVLTTLAKASQVSGHSIPESLSQIKYFAPGFHQAGVAPDDIINLYALLDRMGYGAGRGGTGLNMIMKNLVSPRGQTKFAAMQAMGIYSPDDSLFTARKGHKTAMDVLQKAGLSDTSRFIDERTGNVDFIGFLDYIAKWRDAQKLGGQGAFARRLVARGFDTNAAQVLDAIGTKRGMELFRSIRSQEAKMPNLQDMQAQLMDSLNNQTKRLTSNFATLSSLLEQRNVKRLQNMVSRGADVLGAGVDWAQGHPRQADIIGGGLAAGTAWIIGRMIMGAISTGRNFAAVTAHIGRHGLHPSFYMGERNILHAAGHAGGAAAGGGEGIFARILGGARALGLIGFKPFITAIRDVGSAAAMVGERGGIKLLIGVLGRLGARAIPIIGWLALVGDGFKLLMSHSKNIGKVMGEALGFLIKNVPKWFKAGWPLILGAFKDLVMSIVGLLNPMNWVGVIKDSWSGFFQGLSDQLAPGAQGGPSVVNHFHYHAGANADPAQAKRDAHQHAKVVGGVVMRQVASSTRSTGIVGTGQFLNPTSSSPFALQGTTK